MARGSKLTSEDLNNVRQQLYVKEADGTKTLLVPYRNVYLSKVSPLFPYIEVIVPQDAALHSRK